MADKRRVVVTGAGGFIGHYLVSFLKNEGYWVRGVDQKLPEFSATDADEFELLDLRERASCDRAVRNVHEVYALAADMGGMGYISAHHAKILHDNALINIHTLDAAKDEGVERYLYTSSACVYPEYLQEDANVTPLKEEDAYPGPAAGRLRLGEADRRAPLHVLPRGLRPRHPHRALPQHLRSARDLDGRSREGPGSALPQGGDGEAHRRSGDRDLGRRRADAVLLLHRRLRRVGSTS